MVQENRTTTVKRMKLDCFLTPYIKISSKWIKDLHVRLKAIKPLEKNIDSMIFDISLFLNVSSGKRNKRKNKQMGPHQTKKLLHNTGNY